MVVRALLRLTGLALVFMAVAATSSCRSSAKEATSQSPAESPPERLRVVVHAVFPHSTSSYTQGLIWSTGDLLYESSGGYGQSALRAVRLETGAVEAETLLAANLFAEGLTEVDDRLIQLTWQEGRAISYRPGNLELLGETSYRGEGWGLTDDGQRLVMSDGTHVLTFRDPVTLEVIDKLPVRKQRGPQDRLNELEWVDGSVYANVYETDTIVRIDPSTGRVTAVIDASGLLSEDEAQSAEVLNGIAYRTTTGRFLITGKYWPKIFEVTFEPESSLESVE